MKVKLKLMAIKDIQQSISFKDLGMDQGYRTMRNYRNYDGQYLQQWYMSNTFLTILQKLIKILNMKWAQINFCIAW